MHQLELNHIVERHQRWLKKDGVNWNEMRAVVCNTQIVWKNLDGVDLSHAQFIGTCAKFANFTGSNLAHADFRNADLEGARLIGANLKGANFECANLHRAKLDIREWKRLGRILTEPLTGYKKTREGVVITAEIPVGAIVFCINGKKCRTNRAKIVNMKGHPVLHSMHEQYFEYHLGQEIEIKDFNMMYNVECASGFHFFENRQDAEDY